MDNVVGLVKKTAITLQSKGLGRLRPQRFVRHRPNEFLKNELWRFLIQVLLYRNRPGYDIIGILLFKEEKKRLKMLKKVRENQYIANK